MDVIIFKNELGGVSVCVPTGDKTIDQTQLEDTPVGSVIVSDSNLPNERDFFDAWELENNIVIVNLDKAKQITINRLRAEREPLFAEQDIAFQRALETGADTTAIVAEKNRLRDYTKMVDTCTTTNMLRSLTVKRTGT